MMNRLIKRLVLFFCIGLSSLLFAEPSIQIDTILTDKVDPTGAVKDTFTRTTPVIYVVWKSAHLNADQVIKSVWIAEDTNNVAPPNYKINEAELKVGQTLAMKVISHLPGAEWNGKFSLSKPTKDWPIGKYHVDIYIDGQLIKTLKFNIADEAPVAKPEAKKEGDWGAIAVDAKDHSSDRAYGVGSAANKEEAEKYAQKYCADAGGEQCAVMVSYQQCGAFASFKENQGKGIGSTKQMAEEMAKKECKDTQCSIITSDCNN